MVARAGPPATRNCESRQTRKGAAAAVDVGAGAGTVRVATFEYCQYYQALLRILAVIIASCMITG